MTQHQALPFDPLAARARYVAANAATLEWMLGRGSLHGGFLNTKVNSLSGADYTEADGFRGPAYTYGWIQGRGLESLVMHARFFAQEGPALAQRLEAAARTLYTALRSLFEAHAGHVYFRYGPDLQPIIVGADGGISRQAAAGDLFTYSDIFAIKGLLAAASHFGDESAVARYLDRLDDIVEAIADNRFVHAEQTLLDPTADTTRSDEFGPWMILLGAGGLLQELGLHHRSAFVIPVIERVLGRIWEQTALIPDVRGGDTANPGHAIEFIGFALESGVALPAEMRQHLRKLLSLSFNAGFRAPGVLTSVHRHTLAPLTDKRPWWPLPETIRAASLTYEMSPDADIAAIWATADEAFFTHYWQGGRGYAYQTRDAKGPVDYVPATPDLDPGYHTGLSLLAAIRVLDRMMGRAERNAHE